jgi:hypothetical protein
MQLLYYSNDLTSEYSCISQWNHQKHWIKTLCTEMLLFDIQFELGISRYEQE